MENYIVSARKYRPATFDSVVGQGALTTTLKNAIAAGKLAHAYLFCGPHGVGKTTCARIFAKTINCQHPQPNGEACNECESCAAFNEQRSYNIHELDAASNNSVDDIRQLIEQVRIPPQIGKYKVFIIDEVHMLSSAAFNAFLKTLEEPPSHAIFILATTEKHKILPTILSRCQIYDFNRMSVPDLVHQLQYVAQQEGIDTEPEALNVIAQKADGGMRDALSIFDQVVSFTAGHVKYDEVIRNLNVLDYDYYFRLVDDFLANKVSEVMMLFNEVLNKGFQADHFINGLATHLRDLLVSRDEVTLPLLEVSNQVRERYAEQSKRCNARFLYASMKLCNDCSLNYRTSKNKRLLVEITLIQCAQLTLEEDASSGRLRPTRKLKAIFKQQPVASATASVQPAQTVGQTPMSQIKVSADNQKESSPKPSAQPEGAVHKLPDFLQNVSNRTNKPKILNLTSLSGSIRETQEEVRKREEQATRQVMQEQQREKLRTPVSNEGVRFFWTEFLQLLPQEDAAIRGRMENLKPTLIEPEEFEVLVENSQVAEYMEQIRPRVEPHIRRGVKNDYLTMKVRVAEPDEIKRAYSPRERFALMCERNQALKRLQVQFNLNIR